MKKLDIKKVLYAVLAVLIVIFVVLICVLSAKGKNGSKILFFGSKDDGTESAASPLLGSWTTDGVTVYEFYEGGKGAMKVPLSDYEFSYTVNKNKVLIDFVNEDSKDYEYEFTFEGDNLILNGENGKFEFKKNE